MKSSLISAPAPNGRDVTTAMQRQLRPVALQWLVPTNGEYVSSDLVRYWPSESGRLPAGQAMGERAETDLNKTELRSRS